MKGGEWHGPETLSRIGKLDAWGEVGETIAPKPAYQSLERVSLGADLALSAAEMGVFPITVRHLISTKVKQLGPDAWLGSDLPDQTVVIASDCLRTTGAQGDEEHVYA